MMKRPIDFILHHVDEMPTLDGTTQLTGTVEASLVPSHRDGDVIITGFVLEQYKNIYYVTKSCSYSETETYVVYVASRN